MLENYKNLKWFIIANIRAPLNQPPKHAISRALILGNSKLDSLPQVKDYILRIILIQINQNNLNFILYIYIYIFLIKHLILNKFIKLRFTIIYYFIFFQNQPLHYLMFTSMINPSVIFLPKSSNIYNNF